MTYLVFNAESAATTALATIEDRYGCPYTSGSYAMERWDTVTKAASENKWYFKKPQARLGKTVEELMDGITAGDEIQTLPDGWVVSE